MSTSDLATIDAVILAGGLGTRLKSVVPDQQKVFAAVGEQPFVARIVAQLQRAGVRRVIFALGHLAEAAQPWIARWRRESGLELLESIEASPQGTGGALRLALPLCQSASILVLNGDSFVDADLPGFAATHREDARPISLCAVQVPDASRFGALELDEVGHSVRAFHEKNPLATGPAWINAGIYLMQREVIEAIAPDRPVSLEREVFPAYTDGRLSAFCQHKPFIDIGTPESFAAGASFFAKAP